MAKKREKKGSRKKKNNQETKKIVTPEYELKQVLDQALNRLREISKKYELPKE